LDEFWQNQESKYIQEPDLTRTSTAGNLDYPVM